MWAAALVLVFIVISFYVVYFRLDKDYRKARIAKLKSSGLTISGQDLKSQCEKLVKVLKIQFDYKAEYWAILRDDYVIDSKNRIIKGGKLIVGIEENELVDYLKLIKCDILELAIIR